MTRPPITFIVTAGGKYRAEFETFGEARSWMQHKHPVGGRVEENLNQRRKKTPLKKSS